MDWSHRPLFSPNRPVTTHVETIETAPEEQEAEAGLWSQRMGSTDSWLNTEDFHARGI